jgi:hypothetical protein
MSIKEKTLSEIENKIQSIEDTIAEKGIGSSYLSKAERIQRDVNLGLFLGGATALLGVSAWLAFKSND